MNKNLAKILAKMIQLYRASYVMSTKALMGSNSIEQAMLKALQGTKFMSPGKSTGSLKTVTNSLLKTISEGNYSSIKMK